MAVDPSLPKTRKILNQSVLAGGQGDGPGADGPGPGVGVEAEAEAVFPVASAPFEGPDAAAAKRSNRRHALYTREAVNSLHTVNVVRATNPRSSDASKAPGSIAVSLGNSFYVTSTRSLRLTQAHSPTSFASSRVL